jgi:3-methyladenine DNA glycosylase AlkD
MRALAKSIYHDNGDRWLVDDALAFAEPLVRDRCLEAKSVGIEVVALYRRQMTPRLLPTFKRWLRDGYSSNWATTDAICGYLIGPLILAHPSSSRRVAAWARDRNMWVRRASAVSLIPSARRGIALDLAYDVARRLHRDREDLIQKAVGWMLREAGKADPRRLEQYLREQGPAIPRTTLRYAVERFDEATRHQIMEGTRRRGMTASRRRE